MANNPPCVFEGCETPATFVGTFFTNGESVTVCDEHFVVFAAGTLEAMTGVPVGEIIATAQSSGHEVTKTPTPKPEAPGHTSDTSPEAGTVTDLEADSAAELQHELDDDERQRRHDESLTSLDTE